MTPTNKLRFVERQITVPIGAGMAEIKVVRILQQLFERLSSSGVVIETKWIDVPVEKE